MAISKETDARANAARALRVRAMLVLAVILPVHLILDAAYRPWARQQPFSDWGLSSSFTQVTAVVGIAAVMVFSEREHWWNDRPSEVLLLLVPLISMVGYECLQAWLPWTTFDRMDLVWSVVGGGLAAGIKRVVYDPVARTSGHTGR
jgi:hypothetical protein